MGMVTMYWKSEPGDPTRGTMVGMLPDGTWYAGRYFEVVATTATYGYPWVGWGPYWEDWGAYGGGWPQLVQIYTGHVIAELRAEDPSKALQCRFVVARPVDGPAGGGVGECRLSDGRMIRDVVLAKK